MQSLAANFARWASLQSPGVFHLIHGEPLAAHPLNARREELASSEITATPEVGTRVVFSVSDLDLPVEPIAGDRVHTGPVDETWNQRQLASTGLEVVRVVRKQGRTFLECAA